MIVAILGAGPAGMSCANACLSFGLTPVVIERHAQVGGIQRANFHENLWMLGSPGETGQSLTERLAEHFHSLAVRTLFRTTVQHIQSAAQGGFDLQLRSEGQVASTLHTDAIVLCTGMRPRATPELLALADASTRVVIGPLNAVIRDHMCAARVLILGGGDNALDHARFLAERGNRVTVCTRTRFSGRETLLAACRAHPLITLRPDCRADTFMAQAQGVAAHWPDDEQVEPFDWLLVMFGYQPNSEVVTCFDPAIRPERDARGHVQVDGWLRTTVSGVYAAGDVIDNVQPAVPTAIAQGLAAAKAIERGRHHGGQVPFGGLNH